MSPGDKKFFTYRELLPTYALSQPEQNSEMTPHQGYSDIRSDNI
jgi:hypothetical protein